MYTAKDFSFNLLCDLEETGLTLDEMDRKPMSLVRMYFTFCSGLDKIKAGAELENHLINGGSFDDILDVMGTKMEESGFFRALYKEAETGEDETSTENTKSGHEKA